jgi:hypothetical protein
MLGRGRFWVGVLAASVAGCGGGDDDDEAVSTVSGLAGIYQTISDDYYQPCDGAPTNTGNEPPYFRIVDEALFNGLFISVYRCTSSAPSSCDDENSGSPLVFLAEQTAGGVFHAESSERFGNGVDCYASFLADDVRKSTAGVTLASEERSGGWSGVDCAGEFTDALVAKTKTLPCFQREVREGALVP